METMKINQLEVENVKRIKAVKVEPTANGLTIIGGNNNQGKTSVLDAIAWALGGDRYRPSQATRDGSLIPPNLHIVMSNGLFNPEVIVLIKFFCKTWCYDLSRTD